MLTEERLKQLLTYDPETGLFTWKVDKKSAKKGSVCGNNTVQPYIEVHIDGTKYLAHRLAFLYQTGRLPQNIIDHINGNGRDNRFTNLRVATTSQNAMNKRKSRNSSTGVKNVTFRKDRGKYAVIVEVNGKGKSFGHHETLELAELVAHYARESVHKEFAKND